MEKNIILFDLIKNNKWDEFIKYLEKNKNIDVNIRDINGNYLISVAVLLNNTEAIKLLINRGSRLDIIDNEGRSILYIPIKYVYKELFNNLLEYNNKIVGISLTDVKDNFNNIPLHYAIKNKNEYFTTKLLEGGSNVNIKNDKGFNSLHLAIYSRNCKIVELVLNQNININSKTKTGETSIHIACNFQLEDIINLLIKYGIDLNIKDYENEFSALHYIINLNNVKILKILLKEGADPNIQDAFGNTPLHYSILEGNFEASNFLINSEYTKNIINFNLYNIDSKLPLHLLFEVDGGDELIGPLIKGSNLNLQNKEGISIMHYLSYDNYWKKYYNLLVKKKLDIFLLDKNNMRPIDYVDKEDIKEYIDMITESYIYILRNHNFIWEKSWENMCKKELFKENITDEEFKNLLSSVKIKDKSDKSNNDLCYDIVRKKIVDLYKKKSSSCGNTSYPSKINKKCIRISQGKELEHCSFTGITLDVLTGLIYLLNKHNFACSTLNTNFSPNLELCKYYQSIGIITNTRCEFHNFEIVWVYQKLFLSENFKENFTKCEKNKSKRFIIIPIGIELRQGSHANYLIYDKKTKEIERFEPYGSHPPFKFDYNPSLLDNILEYRFEEIDKNIKYIKPTDYLPKIAFQVFDTVEKKTKKIGDPGGFCALWTIWYTDFRLTYYDMNRKSLVKKLLKNIKQENISFRNLIRNYSYSITNIRDKIFKKVGITINNWLNDQYSEEQLIEIINELTKLVRKHT